MANKIKHNTNSSHNLIKALKAEREKGNDSCIGIIPEKELFNRSTLDREPIVEMAEDPAVYKRQRKFFDEINMVFTKITQRL